MSLFSNATKEPLDIQNLYMGYPAFLLCNGPSLATMPLDQLARPGILTMGVNNGPATFRPNLWVMGDDVGNFTKSIWLDPKIMKFAPNPKAGNRIWDNEKWEPMPTTVGECPGMVYFTRRDTMHRIDYKDFLGLPDVYWGNHADLCVCGFERTPPPERCGCGGRWKNVWRECVCGAQWPDKGDAGTVCPKCGKDDLYNIIKVCRKCNAHDKKFRVCPGCEANHFGTRNVMFLAIRILYELGIRTIYLLGTDFRMAADYTYSFEQSRAKGALQNNNHFYGEMNYRFGLLRPHLEAGGLNIYNCTPESGLKAFDHVDLADAIANVTRALPPAVKDPCGLWRIDERTEGLYNRKADEKAKAKLAEKVGGGEMTMAELKEMKRV